MARGNVSIVFPDAGQVFNLPYVVASGSVTSINAGEPTKSTTVGQVVAGADADGTTSQKFAGISKTDSTDTASANGSVNVYLPYPGIAYAAKAKSSTAAITQTLINALCFKRVIWDLTSSVWTVDTAASNSATNGLVIIGGNPVTNTLFFSISPQCTVFDNPTTA